MLAVLPYAPNAAWEGSAERYFTTSVSSVQWIAQAEPTTADGYDLAPLQPQTGGEWFVYPQQGGAVESPKRGQVHFS